MVYQHPFLGFGLIASRGSAPERSASKTPECRGECQKLSAAGLEPPPAEVPTAWKRAGVRPTALINPLRETEVLGSDASFIPQPPQCR